MTGPTPPSAPSDPTPPEQPAARSVALQTRGATLAVTNLIKVGGLIAAVHEMVFRSELRPLAIALSGLMLIGAQLSEDLLLRAVDRFLGRDS